MLKGGGNGRNRNLPPSKMRAQKSHSLTVFGSLGEQKKAH